jgi:hypothetical protein
MATVYMVPVGPLYQALTDTGAIGNGYKLYTYVGGTVSTLQTTYTDSTGTVANSNPIILGSNGRFQSVNVWVTTGVTLKLVLTDSTGAAITGGTIDNVPAINNVTAATVTYTPSGTGASTRAVSAKLAETVSVLDYGADNTGSTDSSTAFTNAVAAGVEVFVPSGTYKISSAVSLPAGCVITGIGRPTINANSNGQHIFQAVSVATVTVRGIKFAGTSSSTVPSTNVGSFGAASTGLVTLVNCTDVRIEDCEFATFYNGVTVVKCTRAWIRDNRVTAFYLHGILASQTAYFAIDDNVVTGCTQAGGVVAYGIHATGDQAGGYTEQLCSISHNKINGVASWDGIMSHDVSGLIIDGNDIRDVRSGIDVGHYAATNVVKNIVISNNYIESTATNAWASTPANCLGIGVVGYDASNRVDGVTITGNVMRNFFTTAGMVGAGYPSNIVVAQADNATVTGNVVIAAGSVVNNAGVYVVGTVNRLTISGNTMQGSMGLGGIRFSSVTSDGVSVTGNIIKQTSTAVEGVLFSGSTVTALAVSGNPTNSLTPWSQTSSTLTLTGTELEGSVVYDPPNLVDGAGTTTTVTVTGAALGDYVIPSFSNDVQNITVTGYVSAANTVSVRFQNESAGSVDLASGTLRARVIKKISA